MPPRSAIISSYVAHIERAGGAGEAHSPSIYEALLGEFRVPREVITQAILDHEAQTQKRNLRC